MSTPAKKNRSHKKAVPANNQQQQKSVEIPAANTEKRDREMLDFIDTYRQSWYSMIGGAIQNASTPQEAQHYIALGNRFAGLCGVDMSWQHQQRSMAAGA